MTAAKEPVADVGPDASRGWLAWITIAVALSGVIVSVWATVTEWGGVTHGHPAYGVLLLFTLLVSFVVGGFTLRRQTRRTGTWWRVVRIGLVVVGIVWIASMAWLRPNTAVEPALSALASDEAVAVDESPTQIVMTPEGSLSSTGVFFQPGALVDARAYASVLRPLASAGHTVVIPKQPLGIAFFSLGAFDDVREAYPDISGWVVSGHSLGGTVASIQADDTDQASTSPAIGLVLYASYPPGNISTSLRVPVLSISGTQDGLATPDQIDASRVDLPSAAEFTAIDGASHAQFGAYGTQSGDNPPQISDADAREQISTASLDFVTSVAP